MLFTLESISNEKTCSEIKEGNMFVDNNVVILFQARSTPDLPNFKPPVEMAKAG